MPNTMSRHIVRNDMPQPQSETPPRDTSTLPDTSLHAPPGRARKSRPLGLQSLGLDRFSGLWLMALLILIFSLWVPSTFFTVSNLHNILNEQAITALVALGLLVPLAAGVYDLSIGANMGLAVILVTHFQSADHIAAIPSVILTLLAGTLIGVVNGLVVTRFRVNSFITTLGSSSVLLALTTAVSKNSQVVLGISHNFDNAGQGTLFGFSYPVYYALALAVVIWYLLELTPGGRYLYALGSNPDATRLAGLRINRLTVASLIASGLIGALAGVVYAASIGAGALDAGTPYLLPGFAAVFLGSTQLKAGRVNVGGTIVAILLLAVGVTGLQLVGLPLWIDDLFNGLALIVAVAIASSRKTARLSATG